MCDYGAHVVKVFDLERNKFYVLGGDTPPTTAPTNLCVSDDGYKFVVESMPALIQVFDPDDNYVTTFKVKDGRPGGVAAVGGELFVTDVTNDRILVLDRGTGKLIRTIGGKGKEPGQFLMPNAITDRRAGQLVRQRPHELPVPEAGSQRQIPAVGRRRRRQLRQIRPPAGNRESARTASSTSSNQSITWCRCSTSRATC